ncbi:hypothetical protein [Thalassospira xiamenensis]|uniref:hypothetical protein n=1 Tax=Thalassospira xiamenensis TaxID=220697 RepID=UPI0015F11E3D|nr:hypothetical protein [Thalassospira xiamenensis]
MCRPVGAVAAFVFAVSAAAIFAATVTAWGVGAMRGAAYIRAGFVARALREAA